METPLVEDGVVISNAQLDCRLLEGEIVVAHIKREHVLQAAWVVLKVALYADDEAEAARRQLQRLNDPTAHAVEDGPAIAPMRALILDGDGATLVMGRRHWGLVRESGLDRLVEVAPHAWRAFEFNLGHMVAEVPGVVNHLAKLMADDNISVLHHSTYGSEIFLVQQRELSKAISCIRKKVDATLSFLLEQRSASVPASTDSEGTPPPPESPLKATSSTATSSGNSSSSSSNAPSPAAGGTAKSSTTTTEAQKGLRERLRVRQWQKPAAAAAPAPQEAPLHYGHSHRGYEGEGDGDVEPGSPSPAHHGQRRFLVPHLQHPPPSHHVHSSAHHLWPGNDTVPSPPPPLSSSPFSLQPPPPQGCPPPQLVLRVMPKRLVLARIHKECLLECAGVLTRLFLFDQAPAQHFSSSSHAAQTGSASVSLVRKQHYQQRERSLSLSRGDVEQQQGSSPAASAHASSVPRLIPRNTTVHNTPSSSTLASSVSPSIVGISPAESLAISPALEVSHPSHQHQHQQQAPYHGDTDFGPLALIEMEGQEVTLLLPEEDLPLFPMGALVACPLRWTPIKLCGRRFGFHETGVVSAMSKVDAGVPILNVSTFLTNVTLVRILDLPATLGTLSEELDASIDGLHTLGPLEEEGEEEEEEEGEREELVARMAGLGSVGGHGRV